MPEKPRDIAAFKEKLIPHSAFEGFGAEKLYQFEGRDDLVVRPLKWEREVESRHFRPAGIEEISAQDYARISKQHFDELSAYGIEVPVRFVVAQRDKETTAEDAQREVYAVVDKILPAEKNDKSGEKVQEYARMRTGLLEYYTKKFETPESYLADIWHNGQYIYGKKQAEADGNHLYLVDIEPYIYQGREYLHRILLDGIEEIKAESEYFNNPPAYVSIIEGFKTLFKRVEEATGKEKG